MARAGWCRRWKAATTCRAWRAASPPTCRPSSALADTPRVPRAASGHPRPALDRRWRFPGLNDPWPAKRRGRAGYAFVAAPVDAADSDSCARAVDDIRRRFGPVSVLVSNAGVTQDASLRKMTRDPWQQV
ncbi:MAG: SDR family NAD(P)-dependent oxidoreductase, partial [Burkholderiales bacterium]|nr:SDR family NAD(P)-dependent oxidoreductase [Burkholderiales bacterium]